MKSNEEFIAGIYEKAAHYAKKDEKPKAMAWKSPALRMAAVAAVCLGLAGIGAATLRHGDGGVESPAEGDADAIMLLNLPEGEDGDIGAARYRRMPLQEESTLTGTVESVDTEGGILWVRLESWDQAADAQEEGALVAIRWDALEELPWEAATGTRLMAAGEAGWYEHAEAEVPGTPQLTVTDAAKLWIWIEEEHTYKNYRGEEQK